MAEKVDRRVRKTKAQLAVVNLLLDFLNILLCKLFFHDCISLLLLLLSIPALYWLNHSRRASFCQIITVHSVPDNPLHDAQDLCIWYLPQEVMCRILDHSVSQFCNMFG